MAEILFGTASFAYEGWKGIVYHERYRESTFRVECLREYAQYPPFRTVEFDFPFYRPPTETQLRRYACGPAAGFPVVSKVWEELTIKRFPELPGKPDGAPPRHAGRANAENPRYLDAAGLPRRGPARLRAGVRGPRRTLRAGVSDGVAADPGGARRVPRARLDAFLAEAPPADSYAVEIRTPAYFTREYFDVLRRRNAAHVFNWWTRTPPLLEQWEAAQPLPASRSPLIRVLVPPGMPYAQAVERFRPYDRILAPREDMRRDLVRLIRHVTEAGADAFVLVNNRAEGCAPLTIRALARELGIPVEDPPRLATDAVDVAISDSLLDGDDDAVLEDDGLAHALVGPRLARGAGSGRLGRGLVGRRRGGGAPGPASCSR